MEDLIKALQILLKYGNPYKPLSCQHDILYTCGIDDEKVTPDDKAELEKLGFEVDEEEGGFLSYRYGSC